MLAADNNYSGTPFGADSRRSSQHEHYLNYMQYVLSLVGFTVGFGSFWRFPYIVYENGGGVFFIPYILAMVLFGVPLLYLETAAGQMYQQPITKIYQSISGSLRMFGLLTISVAFVVSTYYNLLLCYSYRFVFAAFLDPMPFAHELPNSSTYYFSTTVLEKTPSIGEFGGINYPLMFFYLFSLYVCYECIKRGIKVGGKILIVTVILPYIFIAVLTIRGLSLEGSEQGIKYLFAPDWSKLYQPRIWVDALVQVFYQTTVASGGVVCYGSRKPKNEPFLSILYIVPLGLILCGVLSGLVVFMYVGHFCHESGLQIHEVSLNGLELVFNVFPKAISILPWANAWFLLFCIVLILLGIDSMFGFLELISQAIQSESTNSKLKVCCLEIPSNKVKLLNIVAIAVWSPLYCSRAGIHYLQYFDRFIPGVGLSFCAFFEVYVLTYLCDLNVLVREAERSTG